MTLPLHGETVELVRLQCFPYGKKKGYKVIAKFDGFEIAPFEDFWELDDMLEAAGHAKPDYQHGHVISLPHIQAVIMDVDNSYRVQSVIASNGTAINRDDVIEAQRQKREAQQSRFAAYRGKSFGERVAIAQQRKADQDKQAREQEMAKRFAHGEQLMSYWLTQIRASGINQWAS